MLVLSRKIGERILIGENVAITVVRISPETVRIGIEAPHDMPVIREEIISKENGKRPTDTEKGVEISLQNLLSTPSQVTF